RTQGSLSPAWAWPYRAGPRQAIIALDVPHADGADGSHLAWVVRRPGGLPGCRVISDSSAWRPAAVALDPRRARAAGATAQPGSGDTQRPAFGPAATGRHRPPDRRPGREGAE